MRRTEKIFFITTDPQTIELILKPKLLVLKECYNVFIVSSDRKKIKKIASELGVRGIWVPMKREISPFFDLVSIVMAFLVFLYYRPSVVHSFTPKAGLVSMIAAWCAFVRYRIHTYTGLVFPAFGGIKKKIIVACDFLVFFLSTKVVAESVGVKNQLKSVGINSMKVEMIGYGNVVGVDTDYFSPIGNDFQPNDMDGSKFLKSGFTFCFVGRINKDKGIEELVSAFSEMPSDCSLIIVGGTDYSNPPSTSVLNLIAGDSRIMAVGFQENVRLYIGLCDVFVLPSYREGFPNVLLQACSMGKPAIVTDVPGSNEIIENGKNGWIVPIKNSNALLDAMASSYRITKKERIEMGAFSRVRVVERHNRNDHMKKVLAFYRDFLG